MHDSDSAKRMVQAGYNRIAAEYLDARERWPEDYTVERIDRMAEQLEEGACVLDLGCGSGHPYGTYLDIRFRVIGVDILPGQLRLGQELESGPEFVLADMASLPFGPGSFGAIMALYSIIHLPREELEDLYAGLRELLRPRGRIFAVLGQTEWVGTEQDWLVDGVEMYWSQFAGDRSVELLEEAGFKVLTSELIPDPVDQSVNHVYVVAERT